MKKKVVKKAVKKVSPNQEIEQSKVGRPRIVAPAELIEVVTRTLQKYSGGVYFKGNNKVVGQDDSIALANYRFEASVIVTAIMHEDGGFNVREHDFNIKYCKDCQ